MHYTCTMRPGRTIQTVVYSQKLKPVVWLGSSRAAVHAFPPRARKATGQALRTVQLGLQAPDGKSMTSIGSGVIELRVHAGGEYRVIYVAKHVEAIYVLHAFEKRTQRTRQGDLERARARLRKLGQSRHA